MALVYSQRSKRAGCCLFQVLALHACTTFSLLSDTAAASVESVTTADVWTSSRENVTIVRSAEELKRAVQSGVPHIELQEHIFFTSPALNYLGIVPDTVKSIRGNCDHLPAEKGWIWKTEAIDSLSGAHWDSVEAESSETALQRARYAAPKRPLVPRQCVIATSRGLMVVVGRLWLDGVYIRRRSNHLARSGDEFTCVKVTGAGQLWATDVTLQETLIADHRGSGFSSPINVTLGATLSMLDTTITGTDSTQDTGRSGEDKMLTGAAISAYTGSKVRLQACSLEGNQVAHNLESLHDGTVTGAAETLGAKFYVDKPKEEVWWDQLMHLRPPQKLVSVPYGTRFLGTENSWFVNIQKALSPIPRLTPPSELSISDPSIPEENRPGGTNLHPHEPITVMSGLPTRAQTYEVLQDAEPEQTQEDFGRLRDAGKGEGSQKLLKLPRSNLPKQEVAVRTKEELDRVMREGAEHIVLLNHLDFQHLESPAALSIIPDTLQSLRGNCTCLPEETFKWAGSDKDTPCADHEDPTFSDIAAPLPLKPRQCLIEVQQGGLRVVGRLLLEGIYFKRVVPQESDVVPSKLIQVHGAGELYMKDVTLQGGGASTHDTQALHVSSKAFGQDVVVAHTDGGPSAMTVSMGATLSLKESCMHHTEVTGPFSGLVLVGDEGKLRLQAFSMHDNEVPAPQQVFVEHAAADGTFMYSDAVRAFCGMGARGCVTLHMKPVQAVPPETAFLALSDTWPKLLEEALMPIDRESEPECQEGGFIERAAMRLVAWLLTLSVFEILSLIFATITSLFCCFKVNSCVNASAEDRIQRRSDRQTLLNRWRQAGWLMASRFQKAIKRRIPGLPNPERMGPHIEEIGAPGVAIMPPGRVQGADLVAPPELDAVLVPAMLPESQNAAGDFSKIIKDLVEGLEDGTLPAKEDGGDQSESKSGAGPRVRRNHALVSDGGGRDDVEVIDISGEDGDHVGVLNLRLDQPLAPGSRENEEEESGDTGDKKKPSVLQTTWF